ncbi:hypothetical protein K7G98_38250, partial [Saccharothrix sp. MB29]|nr:hypothetical protein [Saccharothrix sp. MB29]
AVVVRQEQRHQPPDQLVRRPADGKRIESTDSPLWRDHVTFSEYFDGDTGEGLGATHQTGWTALVASLMTDRRQTSAPGT